LNPHQVEAGLVLTQYWSERKRKILIIAPSSLRKQWSMELKENDTPTDIPFEEVRLLDDDIEAKSLLSALTKGFEGVFGASDEVLGSIEENETTNQTHFLNQSIKLEKWSEDKSASANKELKDTNSKIKELNRQSRAIANIAEQTDIQLQIQAQERKKRKLQRSILDEIDEQRDKLIEELKKAKEQTITTNELFTIQWEII